MLHLDACLEEREVEMWMSGISMRSYFSWQVVSMYMRIVVEVRCSVVKNRAASEDRADIISSYRVKHLCHLRQDG
jgi:hypothetical protein